MNRHRCEDCGEYFETVSLWVCPDDKLRCGFCMLEREEKQWAADPDQETDGPTGRIIQ